MKIFTRRKDPGLHSSLPSLFQSANWFRVNPIIVKEIRSRMRGPRVFITLTITLLMLGGMMYAVLQIMLANSRYSNILSPQIGQVLFAALVFLELFMICVITPAVTAGAISSEKERLTYEMLMSTPLSPTSVLWGKLISALSYIFLLLFAGVPLASVVFIFGGVALPEMLKGLLVLLMFAVVFGILGLFFSALFGRTGRATVASFLSVILFMIGPLFLAGVVGIMRRGEPPRWILAPSPVSALSAALAPSMDQNSAGNVFYALSGIFNMGISPISQTSIPRPLYHYTIPFYAVLSLILYLLSTRLVQPVHRWRLRRKELLLGIGSVVVLLGLFTLGYFLTASRYEWAVNPQAGVQNGIGIAKAIPLGQTGPIVAKQVFAQPDIPDSPFTPTPIPTATATPLPGVTTLPGASPVLDDAAQAEIYAAVARQMYIIDHTFGKNPPNWPLVYIITTTDDKAGDPNIPQQPAVLLSKTVTAGISQRLNDLPAKITWIDAHTNAPLDPKNGQVDGGKGVIFTFGNLQPQKDGTVQVSASLYFASLGAAGKTYIVSKVDGVWKITGTTGAEWIS